MKQFQTNKQLEMFYILRKRGNLRISFEICRYFSSFSLSFSVYFVFSFFPFPLFRYLSAVHVSPVIGVVLGVLYCTMRRRRGRKRSKGKLKRQKIEMEDEEACLRSECRRRELIQSDFVIYFSVYETE